MSTTTKTVAQWITNHADFPAREKSGGFSEAKVRAFCRRKKLGPFNPRKAPQRTDTLAAARIEYLKERTASERIARQQAEVEQAIQLKQLIFSADAETFYQQTVGTSVTVLGQLPDAVGRIVAPLIGSDRSAEVERAVGRIVDDALMMIRHLLIKAGDSKEADDDDAI